MTTISTRLAFAFAENPWDLTFRRKGARKNPARHPSRMNGRAGTDLLNNSLVVSCVVGDGVNTYSTAPTGWTFQAKNVGGQNTGAPEYECVVGS